MSFKKDGTDPTLDRRPFVIHGGLKLVGEFILSAMGLVTTNEQPEDSLRYRRSKRPQQRPTRRRNMLIVSKRVRRKHRRAA